MNLNPLALVDRVLTHYVNRAIGLTEAQKDALVTPEAIAQMWSEAHPTCGGCGRSQHECPADCGARLAGCWER